MDARHKGLSDGGQDLHVRDSLGRSALDAQDLELWQSIAFSNSSEATGVKRAIHRSSGPSPFALSATAMSSSPLPPTTPPCGVDAMLNAMDEPTPIAPSRKRPHAALDTSSDKEDDDEQLPANVFSLTSRNVAQMLQRLGESKRLRAD
jgi:hypothetical protein